jgi:hypothetical protein
MAYPTNEQMRVAVRTKIEGARQRMAATGELRVRVKLGLPYAPVDVHACGKVTVAETGMRVFSLEVTDE